MAKLRKIRNDRGSTLALIAAITAGLVVALIFFCLNYARLLGSNAEQKKAVEAAALIAASDISKIVINTKECGYVSMSDQAPIGKLTVAGDQFFLPVHGINTLVGTARLEAIIADKMPNSGIMSTLAQNDLNDAISVIGQLKTVLDASLTSTGSKKAVDRDNNPVTPYQDAETAYQQNDVRISGSANYVNGSMKLTLGSLTSPADTNIPVPQPNATAPVASNLQINGSYKSFVNVPYNGVNYVFGAVGTSTRLVDHRTFATTIAGLAYQVPTIVQAEADELIKTSQTPNGAIFHTVACAEPSSVFDPKPAPGALAIEFPDGALPEFKKPGDLLTYNGLQTGNSSNATIATAVGGDYPIDPTSALQANPSPWPSDVASTSLQDIWRCTLLDWIRRAGTKANIDQVINMQSMAFAPSLPDTDWFAQEVISVVKFTDETLATGGPKIPMGVMHAYKWDANGNIVYKSQPIAPYPYEVVAEDQLYAEVSGTKGAFTSTAPVLKFKNVTLPSIDDKKNGKVTSIPGDVTITADTDVYIRDQARMQGTISGGKHGGEPMDDTLMASSQLPGTMHDWGMGGSGCGGPGSGSPPLLSAQSDFGDPLPQPIQQPFVNYQNGSAPGAVRPTYTRTGLCGSIRFRRQVQVTGQLASALGTTLYKDQGYIGQKRASMTTYTSSDPLDVVDNYGTK